MPVSSARAPFQFGKKVRMSMPLATLMVPPPVPPVAPNEKLRAIRSPAAAAAATVTRGTPMRAVRPMPVLRGRPEVVNSARACAAGGGCGGDADETAAYAEVAGEGEVRRGGGEEDAAGAAAVLDLLGGGELEAGVKSQEARYSWSRRPSKRCSTCLK